MTLGCPVWTEDADFFGTGDATWTTDRIALYFFMMNAEIKAFAADVLEAFRATGKGWQARMNEALKDWLQTHSPV